MLVIENTPDVILIWLSFELSVEHEESFAIWHMQKKKTYMHKITILIVYAKHFQKSSIFPTGHFIIWECYTCHTCFVQISTFTQKGLAAFCYN